MLLLGVKKAEHMTQHFHSIFRRAASPIARAKFLSKIFGIFSEEIVSLWAQDERARYDSLGRPTINTPGDNRRYALDFTLRERSSGNIYVAEMKCEIEYQNFKYFVLERVERLEHHKKPAFEGLFELAPSIKIKKKRRKLTALDMARARSHRSRCSRVYSNKASYQY